MPAHEHRASTPTRLALFVLATLLLAGALLATYSSLLAAPPNTFAGRYDVFRYYGPLTFYNDFSIHEGSFPLWNPMVYCGTPNVGNPQSFLYYPPNLLRSLLLPNVSPYTTQVSLIVLMGIHLLLAGLFTYLLARAHKLGFAGALAAAFVFVFSALMVRRAAEYHFLFTIAWAPLILLLIKKMLDTTEAPRKLLFTLAAGLFVGLAILGGFLQIIIYLGVTCAFYAVFYRLLDLPRQADQPDRVALRPLFADAACFAVIFVLAGLVAAVVLLTTGELAAFSARYKGSAVPMYSDLMNWTVTRVYQSLVVFPGMKYEAETARGAGVIAWLLVAAGLVHRRYKNTALFMLLLYVLVDCSFGPPFPVASLVNLVTPFSSSAYSRAFDFCLLPIALLAGQGVDVLLLRRPSVPENATRSLFLLYAAAATLIPLSQWIKPNYFLPVSNEVLVLPVLALLLLVVIPWMSTPKRFRLFVALVVTGLLFAEMWSWNRVFFPWMARNTLRESRDFNTIKHHFPETNTRGVDPIANRLLYAMEPVFNGVDPLHLAEMRDFLSGQPRDRESHRLITEWEPTAENQRGNLYLKRFFWLARQYVEAPVPDKQTLFPSATTVFVETPDGALEVPKMTLDRVLGHAISPQALRTELKGTEALLATLVQQRTASFSFPISLPRQTPGGQSGSAGALHSALVLEYESHGKVQVDVQFIDAATKRMQWGKRTRLDRPVNGSGVLEVPAPDFPEAQAIVKVIPSAGASFKATAAYVLSDPLDEDGLIHLRTFTPNVAQLEIAALDGPRILSFLDANYPGWHVYVDGDEAPLLTTNHLFKGVALPAGSHLVEFRFAPRSFVLGLAVSLISSALILLGIIYFGIRALRIPQNVTPPEEEESPPPPVEEAPAISPDLQPM